MKNFLLLSLALLFSFSSYAQKDKKTLNECESLLEEVQFELEALKMERDSLNEMLRVLKSAPNAAEVEKIWTELKTQIAKLQVDMDALQVKYNERTELAKEFREDIVVLTNNKNLVNDAFKNPDGLMIGGYELVDITENNSLHISFSFAYTNANKKINFITLTFNVYDEQLNQLTCEGSHEQEISLLLQGVIKASGSTNNYKAYKRFVNDAASCLKLTKMLVEYSDGSSKTFANQLDQMTNIDFKPCFNVK